jgi:hypothetical protein
MKPRKPRDVWDEWDQVPSGRVPSRPRPTSLRGPVTKALRAAAGSGAKGHATAAPFRADGRRVVVKVRIAQVGSAGGKRAARLHLAYVEREGVERDGSPGRLYGAEGPLERTRFEEERPGEQHQFRIVISPEDAHELNLEDFVRQYMLRIERDLGRELEWGAVHHYDTDNPHAHVLVRGVDRAGRPLRMDRHFVSHGLRQRAEELATRLLGPRPERARVDQLRREAELERYTSLDRVLERRAVEGVVRPAAAERQDPELEAAIKTRLFVLERLGLAERAPRACWRLDPRLRPELEHRQLEAEGLRAIGAVLSVSSERCRVLSRDDARPNHADELDRGIQGVLRWKGLDEQGQFRAVIETTGGLAYYLPVSARFAQEARVGQPLDLKRSIDKDEQIERAVRASRGVFDVGELSEGARPAYRQRLEQLERMQLAMREGTDRWRLREDFRAELDRGARQPDWQRLSLLAEPQPLGAQVTFTGPVWLDRVQRAEIGETGFGQELRARLRARDEFVRGLGLDPASPRLHLQLRDLQQRHLEQTITAEGGGVPTRVVNGLEGTARLRREPNGERFVEVRSRDRFVVGPAPREVEAFDGKHVRLEIDQRRVRVIAVDRDRGLSR